MVFIRRNLPCYSEKENEVVQTKQSVGVGVTLKEICNDQTWFQVLFIEADPGKKQISQTLETRPKGKFAEEEFEEVFIHNPEDSQAKLITHCLPSQGVKFPKELQEDLSDPLYLANYYATARTLFQTRKISQLIAQSWWAYRIYQDFLESLEPQNLERRKQGEPQKDDEYYYHNGNWEELLADLDKFLLDNSHPSSEQKIYIENLKKDIDTHEDKIRQIVFDILDGLIAREIFLTANGSPRGITKINTWHDKNSDKPDPYSTSGSSPETTMLILPSNRSWTGIRLALLFAGQVFRKKYIRKKYFIKKDDDKVESKVEYVVQDKYYEQICQPIMSTEEIVSHYAIELAIESFHGQIDEIPMGLGFDLPYLKVKIPYPPIPTEEQVKINNLKKWFNAPDDSNGESEDLGFFVKKNGKYTTTIQHPTPPYPYIPISTS